MKDVIELAKQAGIRWDTESDCSEWRMRRSELEEFANVVRNAALEDAKSLITRLDNAIVNLQPQEAVTAIEALKEPTP